jgi:ABC-2 type transport system permease protein
MQREGSPWQGLGVVVLKELTDHLASARMRVLELLVLLTALAAVYAAINQVRDVTAQDPFLFLRLFTTARDPLPSFVSFLGFLVPLMAIGLGFDAVNSEHSRRTLSRILSQPIYRDALLFGKFIAGLTTLAISLIVLWLLVIGLGLLMLGVPPGGDEMGRALVFLCVTIAYAGVWLALAMLFSVVFRSAATAALVTLGLWLFLTVIWPALAPAIAEAFVSPDDQATLVTVAQMLSRLSPSTLYGETVLALASHHPHARPGLFQPASRRADGGTLAAMAERAGRLAANCRSDRGDHPVVRRRLRRVPAAGSESLAKWGRATLTVILALPMSGWQFPAQPLQQFLNERPLRRQNLAPRRRQFEIGDAIDFRKALLLARARWPFHLEFIAGEY